jgi:flagellar hook-associated protein 3 FlgL
MRISTSSFYENAGGKISELQSSLAQKQTQIATGRRIQTPSDDPVAASAALDVKQADGINTQFAANRDSAKNALNLQESALTQYTDLLQNIKTLTVAAGNGALDDTQRKYFADQLTNDYQNLLGIGNTQDSSGHYIFAGYKNTTQPFNQTAAGVTYAGDQGQRLLQVSTSRQIALNDSGDAVFQNIRTGNGTYVTSAAAANTGNGIASPGSVTDASKLTGDTYSIDFSVTAGVTSFKVFDVTKDPGKLSLPALSGPYTPGQSIAVDGLQFEISGAPANGDTFGVKPSSNQSIFQTVTDLIATLSSSTAGTTAKANLVASLSVANNNVSSALDSVLTVRASGGARLKELDTLDSEGTDRGLQYATRLSSLQDLDYAKAVTELTQQQVTLQAAQQSFVKIANLSLFDYIK